MKRHTAHRKDAPAAFTLLELLMVVGVIAILAGIAFAVIGNMLSSAKEAATRTTVLKVGQQVQDQVQAVYRHYETTQGQTELRDLGRKYASVTSDPDAQQVLALKEKFKAAFPQNYDEVAALGANSPRIFQRWLSNHDPSNPANSDHISVADSAELLYLALTRGTVRGAPTVDESAFTAREVGDTDGDGFPEFIDDWGRPLRFYRWPTRLLHPGGFVGRPANNDVANTGNVRVTDGAPFETALSSVQNVDPDATLFAAIDSEIFEFDLVNTNTLRAMPGGVGRGAKNTDAVRHSRQTLVRLAPFTELASLLMGQVNTSVLMNDPDDKAGRLLSEIGRAGSGTDIDDAADWVESQFHTVGSYHAPLIVSAGPDKALGLFEPWDTDNGGHLARPGDPEDPTATFRTVVSPGTSPLVDNITNFNVEAGNR